MSEKFFNGDVEQVSQYLNRFRRLAHSSTLILKGDNILVERLPKIEMKSKSGLILGVDIKTYKDTAHDALTQFGVVLMVGPGQVYEDGTIQSTDSKPGDVILLPGNVQWYSGFGHIADYEPYSIGRLRDSQVGMWFQDYKQAFEILNAPDAGAAVERSNNS